MPEKQSLPYNPARPEGLHVLTSYTAGENKLVEMYQKVDEKTGAIDFIAPAVFIGHDVFAIKMRDPSTGQIAKVDQPVSFLIKAGNIAEAVATFKGARQDAVTSMLSDMRRQAIAAGARMDLPSPDESRGG